MAEIEQFASSEILNHISESPALKQAIQGAMDQPLKGTTGVAHQIVILLRYFSEIGKTLEWCAGKNVLDKSEGTLKAYCRKHKIKFEDYVPNCMRPECERRGFGTGKQRTRNKPH